MKLLKGWKLRLLASLAIATAGGQLEAQLLSGGPHSNGKGIFKNLTGGAARDGARDVDMVDCDTEVVVDGSCDAPGCTDGSCSDGSCGAGGIGIGAGHGGPFGGMLGGRYGSQHGGPGGPGYGAEYQFGHHGMMGGPGGMGPGGMGPGGMGPGGPGMCGPQCGAGGCGPGCGLLGGGLAGGGFGGGGFGGGGFVDRYGRSVKGFRHNIRQAIGSNCGVLLPYGEGGVATQRWFDFSAEAVFLARTKGAADFDFSSMGIGGPRVLTADQVDLDDMKAGLGLQANVQLGPGSSLEVSYFGLNSWDESATAESSTYDLYSFISDFGLFPPGGSGFDDPDRSSLHRIDYKSELHNGEINVRRRWNEPSGFWQGSFLGGIRYMDIDEHAQFRAWGASNNAAAAIDPRFFDYKVATRNSLVGFQLGGDLWYNLIPGVKVGGELKTGIFNNSTNQETNIHANSLPGFGISEIHEYADADDVAYITQLNTQLWYRLNYSWAFKGSYQVMYVDGVTLAAENFNSTPPAVFLPGSTRTAMMNNDAEVVYQGFTLGAEYMW